MLFDHEFRISQLIARHLRGELHGAQLEELNAWLKQSELHQNALKGFYEEGQVRKRLEMLNAPNEEVVWDKTLKKLAASNQRIKAASKQINKAALNQRIKVGVVKRIWPHRFQFAAAILLICVGTGLFYFFSKEHNFSDQHNKRQDLTLKSEIHPGKMGATLTLANGTKIPLSDANKGEIVREAGMVVTKNADGQITYETTGGHQNDHQMNTLSTDKGEMYMVILPDKSKVWLNALSSLRYPSSFSNARQRIVSLKGEAYFEIAKDKVHPFIVTTEKQTVEVMGTQFNINSYEDENSSATTLLEGSVRIRPNALSPVEGSFPAKNDGEAAGWKTLVPGELAILNHGQLKIQQADFETALAWKNGLFSYKDAALQTVMRQISRWYNVTVHYEDDQLKGVKLTGSVSRYDEVSGLLNVIQNTGAAQFKIVGRTIYVKH